MVAFGVAAFAAAAGRAARSLQRPRRAPLSLTDTAAARVRELLGKRSKVTAAVHSVQDAMGISTPLGIHDHEDDWTLMFAT